MQARSDRVSKRADATRARTWLLAGRFAIALVLGAATLGGGARSAIADDEFAPDLTIAMSSNPAPIGGYSCDGDACAVLGGGALYFRAGTAVTYTLTLRNPLVRSCDPDTKVCVTGGSGAAGVVVQNTLPPGFAFRSASGTSGFVCSYGGGVVTCTGGNVPRSGAATVTVTAVTPNVAPGDSGTYENVAVVDPLGAIVERSERNNVARLATRILCQGCGLL